MTTILDRPLSSVAAALRDGQTSAQELLEIATDRHQRLDNSLQAYMEWTAEDAAAAARRVDADRRQGASLPPLAGLPISVKDLYGVEGSAIFAGTKDRLPAEWEQEGFLIQALRRQGALLVGRTKMVELAFGGLGGNPHWGTPVNPWDSARHRVPGGSSAGAGVSLWEGSAVIALGSDTACSIRTPAAWTGTVGMRSSPGRWPTDGVVPLSPTLDTVGGLARSVDDFAWFFCAVDPQTAGERAQAHYRELAKRWSSGVSGVRIGIPTTEAWNEGQSDVAEVTRETLRELETKGAVLVDCPCPEIDAAYALYVRSSIIGPEAAAFVRRALPGWEKRLDPSVGERLAAAHAIPATDYLDALTTRRELAASVAPRLEQVDVFATPAVPIPPPTVAEVEDPETYTKLNRLASRTANPVAILGLCALSLPCGLDRGGLPVGLQLVAGRGNDLELLAIAGAVERVLGRAEERLGTPAFCGRA